MCSGLLRFRADGSENDVAAESADRKTVEINVMGVTGTSFDYGVPDLQPLAGDGAGFALERKGCVRRGLFLGHATALAR
jgi:hypothetical protein